MKKLLAVLMILMLAAGCAGCGKAADSPAATQAPPAAESPAAENPAAPEPSESSEAAGAPDTDADSGSPETAPAAVRLEDSGYATPEEAVLAYLDAMNRGDVGAMLGTFAMESYVENVDTAAFMNRNRSYHPVARIAINEIPYADDFVRAMALQVRCGAVASELNVCYAMYALGEDYYNQNQYATAEGRRALAENFRQSPLSSPAGNVEFIKWLNPAILSEGMMVKPGAGSDSLDMLAYAGGDDYTELIALIRINGKLACQPMRCVKYGSRWHNLDFSSQTVYYSGVQESWKQTLWMPADDREIALLAEAISAEDTDESARWDALQQSDWAGTRWPMVSLSVPGVTVYDTAEAAENDSGAGIRAELHFTRVGGAEISVAASPALREQLRLGDGAIRITFSWFTDDIPTVRIMHKRNKEIEISLFTIHAGLEQEKLSVSGVARENDRITFTLADGMQAVFEKPAAAESPAPAESTAAISRLEGSGYGTPEDAVLAYIDALNRGDVRDMLATFAVESYADHADPLFRVELSTSFRPSVDYLLPDPGDYGRSLSSYARYNSLASGFMNCYLDYAANTGGQNTSFKTDEEIRAFREQFGKSALSGLAGNVSFAAWADPVRISKGNIVRPGNRSSLMSEAAVSGADDVAVVVAQVLVKGQMCILPMRCIRYGDRWYNDGPESIIAYQYLKNSTTTSAKLYLWLLSVSEMVEVTQALTGSYEGADEVLKEAVPVWESIQQSGLGGTRWVMTSVSIPGVTVYDTAEAAESDSGAGVRAEILFTGVGGGIVTVSGSPALRQMLKSEDDVSRVFFAWEPAEPDGSGSVSLSSFVVFPREGTTLDLTGVVITRDGAALTAAFPDGTQAVFRQQ